MLSKIYRYLPFFMWFFPLSFFAYQFILRLWPSLMMQPIMHQFAINATAFGLLSSVYYYGYAGIQIPIAILLERFNVRWVLFTCALLCGFATLCFSYTSDWYLALICRFLIGVGSAVGFLGTSKIISQWFHKEQYARMVGLSFTIGLMGAIYGGKPVNVLIESYSWQKVSFVLAIVSICIGVLSFAFLRIGNNESKDRVEHPLNLQDLKIIITSRSIWLLALSNLLLVGTLEGFADVWGIPYLMTAYGISKSHAAEIVSFIFIGMLFGGPLLAYLSRKLGNYHVISLSGLFMVILFMQLLFQAHYQWYILISLFFCLGIMCCYQVIVFAAGSSLVKPALLGITIAFLNCVNMLGGSFFHTVIGFMMDAFWLGGTHADGTRLYTLETYRYALSTIPICASIGVTIVSYLGLKALQASQLKNSKVYDL